MCTRHTFSDQARRSLRLRFGFSLPVLLALPALLLWIHVLRPWPDVERRGVAMVVAMALVVGWALARSARHMAQAARGELDVLFDGASITLPRTGRLRPDQVEWVGAFELPVGPRKAMLRIGSGDQPGPARRRSLAVDLGYYEDAEQLEQRLMEFSGVVIEGESTEA